MIRNQTLKFLSKTLPVLKADDTLPKVTQIIPDEPVDQFDDNGYVNMNELNFGRVLMCVFRYCAAF